MKLMKYIYTFDKYNSINQPKSLPSGYEVVKNVKGSSWFKNPSDMSPLRYWKSEIEKKVGEIDEDKKYCCPGSLCDKGNSVAFKDFDGAHVYKVYEGYDIKAKKGWYFAPLCHDCNTGEGHEDVFTVKTELIPVPPECYELTDEGEKHINEIKWKVEPLKRTFSEKK